MTYRVYAQWAEIDVKSFVAKEIVPFTLQSAKAMDEKSFELQLRNDPQSDLLAGRSVALKAMMGVHCKHNIVIHHVKVLWAFLI